MSYALFRSKEFLERLFYFHNLLLIPPVNNWTSCRTISVGNRARNFNQPPASRSSDFEITCAIRAPLLPALYDPRSDALTNNHSQNLQTCISDTDARSIFSDSSEEEIAEEESGKNEKEEKAFSSRAVNTEPHYLSIGHWHSAEWKTDRKPCREPRVQSAPVKIKPIQTYYYDYAKT